MAAQKRFYNWLVNKIRQRRFALTPSNKIYTQFGFFFGTYSNWKHDPSPLIFIMYSNPQHTHALNTHYMNRTDKEWFSRLLYMIVKGAQNIDGYTLYKLLKLRRHSIIDDCYRVYFTALLNIKMVGAGLTPMYNKVYPFTKDSWLVSVNQMLKPSSLEETSGIKIAFDPNELTNRINQAMNSVPIQSRTVNNPSGQPTSRAPWSNPAPWVK